MARRRARKTGEDMLVRSAEFIGWALGGLEREIAQTRERLAALNAEAVKLRARIGGAAPKRGGAAAAGSDDTSAGRRQGRRRMSAEGRKRISEMMKKRWAERKKKQAQ